MPVTYQFDGSIAVIEVTGDNTISDIVAVISDSIKDRDFPDNAFLLINFGENKIFYKKLPQESAAMSTLISFGPHFNNRIAIVASKDLAFGLLRKGSVGADDFGMDVNVFRDYEAARKWLMT